MKNLHRVHSPRHFRGFLVSCRWLKQHLREDGLMILCLAVFLLAQAWPARVSASEPFADLSEVRAGSLLFVPGSNGSGYVSATRLNAEVDLSVSGLWLEGKVIQHFENQTQDWQEAVYVFPLPERAAVHAMRIRVGERVIEGEIQEKSQARRTYQKAKSEGKRTALLEQKRPNMFSMAVAQIGPGEKVTVEMTYTQTLPYRNNQFELRFPTTINPRYMPGKTLPPNAVANAEEWQRRAERQGPLTQGWATNTDQVPDAAEISPFTVTEQAVGPQSHQLSLRVTLNAGMPVSHIQSTTHTLQITPNDTDTPNQYQIGLSGGSDIMNRDVVITWSPALQHAPESALFSTFDGEYTYGLAMLMPPQMQQTQAAPKELILVIDTSGSMGGTSIAQAKQALQFALTALSEADYFNVIQFNSQASQLFSSSERATQTNRAIAERYVQQLQANGGTEMAQALTLALPKALSDGPEHTEAPNDAMLRQVVFITDGSVGNEEALFGLIQSRLGQSRLFTVGIGSAPNSYFMTKAAEVGRGTYENIDSLPDVADKMSRLFDKIRFPSLKDITLTLNTEAPVEAYPGIVRDLYLGEPVVFSFRVRGNGAQGMISGNTWSERDGVSPWQRDITLAPTSATTEKTLSRIWARQKLDSLMNNWNQPDAQAGIQKEATALALTYHLVSRFTSLVAVDATPVRNVQTDPTLKTSAVPVVLPKGSQAHMLRYPKTATPAPLLHLLAWCTLAGALALLMIARRHRLAGASR